LSSCGRRSICSMATCAMPIWPRTGCDVNHENKLGNGPI
jgi:hypothetical protein